MKPLTITVYNDPGHAWGAVKRSVLFELGLLGEISPYSYQRGKTVYLEEDCDLFKLQKSLELRGVLYHFVEKYTNKRSPIRSYESFGQQSQ
jgi:hypothetical protein